MERAIASMLGGAIGDALGVKQEIFPASRHLPDILQQVAEQRKARSEPQTTYERGGPWEKQGLVLEPGEWTDDTSMMLCLADSILHEQTVDNSSLMHHFIAWWFQGYNSCRGASLGLGANTKHALYSFDYDRPDVIVGGTDPDKHAGNGAIMRLSPVPIYWHDDLCQAIAMAKLQASTTHNVPEAKDASALMTFVIWHGLNGCTKDDTFARLSECQPFIEHAGIAEIALPTALWRSKTRDEIITLPGRSLWTLEAALWCVYHTETFADALIMAVNLGGDADTVGSVTGQIAGAFYGRDSIPSEWIEGLYHCEAIEERAKALFNHLPMNDHMKLHYRS